MFSKFFFIIFITFLSITSSKPIKSNFDITLEKDKEFTIDDFSHEHLTDIGVEILLNTIEILNRNRDAFNTYAESYMHDKKKYWYNMIQLLPSSYNLLVPVLFLNVLIPESVL